MTDDDRTETFDNAVRVELHDDEETLSAEKLSKAVSLEALIHRLTSRDMNVELRIWPRREAVVARRCGLGGEHFIHANANGRTFSEALKECERRVNELEE